MTSCYPTAQTHIRVALGCETGLVRAFALVLGANIWVSLEEISPAGAAATICLVNTKNTFNRPVFPSQTPWVLF